uniref:TIFY motif family protein n=1 Tax=Pohlia nutans TaxID=140635 RepID=A0A4D6QFW2_9BRYO|nr:TIFY motif family protein [Pohlia nutans]
MDVVSPKREQNSVPASPSHTAPDREYFWRMQQPQARKVQTMYAGSAQQFRDEASQRGASQPAYSPEHNPAPGSNQGAFGSPTPVPFHANGAAMAGKRSPFHNHPFQAGTVPNHAHVARAAPGGGKQPATSTAQLTIFYAGVVNVYDDVPFDKAQAIMLLAGSGNTWSGSNYMNPPVAAPARNPFLKTPMAVPSQSTPAPPAPPPRPGVVFSNIRPPPTTNVELPQARKASLARFLEKRKDRVRKVPVSEEGEAAPGSRDKSPDRPVSKPATSRSPSPSPAAAPALPAQHTGPRASPAPAGRRDPPASCSEGPCSPPTKPPGTPPRQNGMLESEKRSPKRRDTNNGTTIAKDDHTNVLQQCSKRARNGRSPHRIPDSLL